MALAVGEDVRLDPVTTGPVPQQSRFRRAILERHPDRDEMGGRSRRHVEGIDVIGLLGAVFEAEGIAHRRAFAQQPLQQGNQAVVQGEMANGTLFQIQVVDLETM